MSPTEPAAPAPRGAALSRPIVDAAVHGSYCPKMCTFTCPVTTATGREDAVPWTFHRTVSDLATGQLPLTEASAARLTACTGCLACREPCAFDQDVPAQVRAGRAALVEAGIVPDAAADAVAHVAAGRTPVGAAVLETPAADDAATLRLAVGCRDRAEDLAAALELLRAAGERVTVHVPAGCCGASLADLGAVGPAEEASRALPTDLPVVTTNPHCLPSWRAVGTEARDLVSHLDDLLAAGRLHFRDDPAEAVTWHDPCLLARAEGVVDPPRRLLAAAGLAPREPEHTREATACSGAGMGMDLLDPAAAEATAAVRAGHLGPGRVVTACARARDQLTAAGASVTDLAAALRPRLRDDRGSSP